MVNDTFIGARAGSWRQEKILQPSMVTFPFPWILQSLCTTFPSSGQVWVGGRALSFQTWTAHDELGAIGTCWYTEVIDNPLLMSLTPGFPQITEYFSHSLIITSSSVKEEVCKFYPFFCQIFVSFIFFQSVCQKKSIAREKKRKQVDPFIVTVQKRLFVLETKMVASDFFPPLSGYINFCY